MDNNNSEIKVVHEVLYVPKALLIQKLALGCNLQVSGLM
jgi:hypothetical protein